ncbi:MAG: TIGR02300 family protein [Solirubrobacterales bacterium]
MPHADLGTKRRCAHCGAPFYDLHHSPIVCPKCHSEHKPEAAMPARASRSGRGSSRSTPDPVLAEPVEVEGFEEEEVAGRDVEEDEDQIIGGGEDEDADEMRE